MPLPRRMFVAAALSTLASPAFAQRLPDADRRLEEFLRSTGQGTSKADPSVTDNFTAIAERFPELHNHRKSTGLVLSQQNNERRSGTCIVLAKDNGTIYLALSGHQAKEATDRKMKVKFFPEKGKIMVADAVIQKPEGDFDIAFAVLPLNQFQSAKQRELANSLPPVRRGANENKKQPYLSLGFPFTAGNKLHAEWHKVESLVLPDETNPTNSREITCMIRITGKIFSGSSGGPVFKGGACVGALAVTRKPFHPEASYIVPIEVIEWAFRKQFPAMAERMNLQAPDPAGEISTRCGLRQNVANVPVGPN